MPHVDEGTLHALLDGALRSMEPERADEVEAHLATCADCRALAGEAAALRGEAADILALLEPTVSPDFDEVLVRAGGATRERDHRERLAGMARWTRSAAWAATLVIALGTGYLIRDRFGPDPLTTISSQEAAREAEDRESGADGGSQGPGRQAITSPRQAAEEASPQRRGAAATPEAGDAGETGATLQAEAAPAGEELRGAEVVEASGADASMSPPGAPVLRTATPQAAPPRSESLMLEAVVVTGSAGLQSPLTPDRAEELLGAPLLVLEEAELVRAWVENEGVPSVASLQRLPGGVELRVTQRPAQGGQTGVAGAAATATAAPTEASSEAADQGSVRSIRITVGAADLLVAGPLPEEALRALALNAVPYGENQRP